MSCLATGLNTIHNCLICFEFLDVTSCWAGQVYAVMAALVANLKSCHATARSCLILCFDIAARLQIRLLTNRIHYTGLTVIMLYFDTFESI